MQIKRAPDQTLIAFACHVELLRAVDLARASVGEDRSTFIRKAILAELKRRSQPVMDEWASPPDRAKKLRYPPVAPALSAEKPSAAAARSAPNQNVAAGNAQKRKPSAAAGKNSAPAPRPRAR